MQHAELQTSALVTGRPVCRMSNSYHSKEVYKVFVGSLQGVWKQQQTDHLHPGGRVVPLGDLWHAIDGLEVRDQVAGLLASQAGEDDAAALLDEQQFIERLCIAGMRVLHDEWVAESQRGMYRIHEALACTPGLFPSLNKLTGIDRHPCMFHELANSMQQRFTPVPW